MTMTDNYWRYKNTLYLFKKKVFAGAQDIKEEKNIHQKIRRKYSCVAKRKRCAKKK
jgi:hypothetical protein